MVASQHAQDVGGFPLTSVMHGSLASKHYSFCWICGGQCQHSELCAGPLREDMGVCYLIASRGSCFRDRAEREVEGL